jgi:hypothetical protein
LYKKVLPAALPITLEPISKILVALELEANQTIEIIAIPSKNK